MGFGIRNRNDRLRPSTRIGVVAEAPDHQSQTRGGMALGPCPVGLWVLGWSLSDLFFFASERAEGVPRVEKMSGREDGITQRPGSDTPTPSLPLGMREGSTRVRRALIALPQPMYETARLKLLS